MKVSFTTPQLIKLADPAQSARIKLALLSGLKRGKWKVESAELEGAREVITDLSSQGGPIMEEAATGALTKLQPPVIAPPIISPELPLQGEKGRYAKIELVGKGGMGEVFRGSDARGKSVVIKFISMGEFTSHLDEAVATGGFTINQSKNEFITFILRFLNEFDIGAKLKHPNLAEVIDNNINLVIPGINMYKDVFRKDPNTGKYTSPANVRDALLADIDLQALKNLEIFIVAEFIPAEPGGLSPATPIAEAFKGSRVSLPVIKTCFMPVFDLFAHVHDKGIAHRDIKPDNFLLTSVGGKPFVKVIDLGIARDTDKEKETRLTKVGSLLGTPTYLPPMDYIAASTGNPEAFKLHDIYALGLVILELMSGKNQLDGLSMAEIFTMKMDLTRFNFAGIDLKAIPVIQRMLSPKIQDNFANMQEVISAWSAV